MIPTVYLVQKITEFGAIYYGHGPDVWENGVRLVHLTARELSDGTQLTMAEHAIRIFAISLISLLAFAFWMFIFTYLNMKLHGVSFSRMSQNDSIRKGEE